MFDTFKRWKAMVETETGLRIKCLRSDNGGEYILIEDLRSIVLLMESGWKRLFLEHHSKMVLLSA